jgi:hypothetical protein
VTFRETRCLDIEKKCRALYSADFDAKKTTADETAWERRQLLDGYKRECESRGIKVTNAMIAKEAGWSDRTPVQRWLRNDPKSSPAEDARIRRVLRKKPHLNKP